MVYREREKLAIPNRSQFLTPRYETTNLLLVVASHVGIVMSAYLLFRYLPTHSAIIMFLPLCLIHQKYLSEWIHEAAHFNFQFSKRRNDLLIDSLAGVFFGNPIAKHREGHMAHHRQKIFFQAEDPDTRMMSVTTRSQLIRAIFFDLCGYNAVRLFLSGFISPGISGRSIKKSDTSILFYFAIAGFHLSLLALLWRIGWALPYFLYYCSLLCLYPLVNRLRLYGQHATIMQDGTASLFESKASRTIDAGYFDRILFTSRLMMYHFEHHTYPQLPYRALHEMARNRDVTDVNVSTTARLPILIAVYRGMRP